MNNEEFETIDKLSKKAEEFFRDNKFIFDKDFCNIIEELISPLIKTILIIKSQIMEKDKIIYNSFISAIYMNILMESHDTFDDRFCFLEHFKTTIIKLEKDINNELDKGVRN
jgi:hypothetical protein